MSVTIKLRGNTEAYWQSANPVPADREVILSTDKGNFKVGDGATAWTSLGYWLPDDLASVIKIVNGKMGVNVDPLQFLHGRLDAASTRLRLDNLRGIDGDETRLQFVMSDGSGGLWNPGAISIHSKNAASKDGYIAISTGGAIITEKVRIDSVGNMGILKTNPTSRLHLSGAIELEEMTPPAAPAANNIRLYAKDNGSGKTQLCVKFSDGTEMILATQP